DEPRLIEQPLLDVREIERSIASKRTANGPAELMLVHRKRVSRQRVRGVERVVPDEVVHRTADGIRAALRDDADVAAERAAEFRLRARRDDLELIDRVDRKRDPTE